MKHSRHLWLTVRRAPRCASGRSARRASAELGRYEHPDVTLDCIALARSMPAGMPGDYGDPGDPRRERPAAGRRRRGLLRLPGQHRAPGARAARPGARAARACTSPMWSPSRRARWPPALGILGTVLMDGPVYPRALAARGIGPRSRAPRPEHGQRGHLRASWSTACSPTARGGVRPRHRRLAARGCDAVALVCTEIPLLVTPESLRCRRSTRPGCWRGGLRGRDRRAAYADLARRPGRKLMHSPPGAASGQYPASDCHRNMLTVRARA